MTARARRRWVPSGRAVGITALVLVVLVGGGYASKPRWQPWWYAATLCGGHVSGGDLAELLPKEQLQAGKDTFGGDGPLKCAVNVDDRHFTLAAEAQLDSAEDAPDGERALAQEFTIPDEPDYVFPRGTPGFYGQFGPVIIQECLEPGRDAEGRKRRLVTRVFSHGVERKASRASLRLAVSLANGASDDLGCGARKLPLPDGVEASRALTLPRAEGTMCGWVARTKLPKSPSGKGWKVTAPTDARAPVTGCSLIDAGTGESAVSLTGWYGEWTDEPFETLLAANVKIPEGLGSDDALMSEDFGRAKARCAGGAGQLPGQKPQRAGQHPASPAAGPGTGPARRVHRGPGGVARLHPPPTPRQHRPPRVPLTADQLCTRGPETLKEVVRQPSARALLTASARGVLEAGFWPVKRLASRTVKGR